MPLIFPSRILREEFVLIFLLGNVDREVVSPFCRAEHGSDRPGQAPKGWRHGRRHGLTARMALSARQGLVLPRAGIKRQRGAVFFGSFLLGEQKK